MIIPDTPTVRLKYSRRGDVSFSSDSKNLKWIQWTFVRVSRDRCPLVTGYMSTHAFDRCCTFCAGTDTIQAVDSGACHFGNMDCCWVWAGKPALDARFAACFPRWPYIHIPQGKGVWSLWDWEWGRLGYQEKESGLCETETESEKKKMMMLSWIGLGEMELASFRGCCRIFIWMGKMIRFCYLEPQSPFEDYTMFIWQMSNYRLQTAASIKKRGYRDSSSCYFCLDCFKELFYLF